MQNLMPYIHLARIDHWFKNIFCLPGIVLVYALTQRVPQISDLSALIIGLLSVCLTASANYTINEILDAGPDKRHPDKVFRPVPSGEVDIHWAYAQYIFLSLASHGIALFVSPLFFLAIFSLWIMGIIYNVPPIRSKEIPYIDALSEAINNPIRLVLGWWMIDDTFLPPVSILVAYWMMGAYFMSLKRYAEYRYIGDSKRAGEYRKSFKYTNDRRLLIAAVVQGNICCLMLGVFLAKFRVELVMSFPFIALLLAVYLGVALRKNSPVQYPEKLYREKGLVCCSLITTAVLVLLLYIDLPWLNKYLKMPTPDVPVSRVAAAKE